MGKYTIHSEDVDTIIESLLKEFVEEIIQYFPDIKCILLTGGFGRGEGTVLIDKEENIRPLKDFDFLLIFEKRVPSKKIFSLQNNLRRRLSPYSTDKYPYKEFSIDLNATTIQNLNIFPDITVFDAKYASHLLYGMDVRDKIKIRNVPLRSGARILFQKGISLIGQLSPQGIHEELSNDEKEMFYYECIKVFIEIGTALSIISGTYEPSYKKRADNLRQNYKNLFPDLFSIYPELGEFIYECTQFKLNPNTSSINIPPLKLWLLARDYLLVVQSYYLKIFLNNKDINFTNESSQLKKLLGHLYYRDILSTIAYREIKLNRPLIITILNKIFQFKGNYDYYRNIKKSPFLKYRITLLDWCCPTLNFFYSTLLLLSFIDDKFEIDNSINEKISQLIRIRICDTKNMKNNWEYIRNLYLEAHHNLPYTY